MIIRKITAEELDAFERVQAVCFTFPYKEEKREEPPKLPENGDYWGSFTDEGVFQGGMIANHYLCRVGGAQHKMAGIGGVTTLPEFRRGGAIRAIFREMFQDLKSKGFVLSGLYPFSHAFYRKFGYEISYTFDYYRLPVSELLGYPQPKSAYMAVESERLDQVRAIYEAFRQERSLTLARPRDEDWKQVWSGDPYKERKYRYILYNDQDQPCAYVCFFVNWKEWEKEPRTLDVRELCFIDKPSLYLALGFLSRFHPHYNNVNLLLPSDVYFTALHKNPYEVDPNPGHNYMMRILDVPAFLDTLDCPEGAGCVTLELRDDFLPENAGMYTIRWDGGKLCSQRGGQDPDIRLDQTSLTQLAMGFMPIDRLRFRQDVELIRNKSQIDALFPQRALFVGDRY